MVIKRRKAKPKRKVIGYYGQGKFHVSAPTAKGVQRTARKATKAAFSKKPLTFMVGGIETRNIHPIYRKD